LDWSAVGITIKAETAVIGIIMQVSAVKTVTGQLADYQLTVELVNSWTDWSTRG